MLIGFRVKNFRSFCDAQEFTFSTSSDRMHAATHCVPTGMKSVRRLSKSAVIFGPNGSGKTNFINAFALMRDLVLHSTNLSQSALAERYTPFLFDDSRHAPTEFEIDVLVRGVRYCYGFSFDGERVRSERLLVYHTGKSQRWFERTWEPDEAGESWAPFSQHLTGPRAMWRDSTRPTALFLTTAAQLNAEQLAPLFDWFEHGVDVSFQSEPANLARVAASIADPDFKKELLEFLRAADVLVHDLRVRDSDRYLEFGHVLGGSPVWLSAEDESAGTQRLARLFHPLRSAIRHGKLLLIDEFDLSLHPLVARHLIELINDPGVSPSGAQLLLTSHNTTLMDVNVLRRDEIWLMQLTDRQSSRLEPVWRSALPPRKSELIAKSYLRGRYGAIPTIGSKPALSH